MCTLFSFVKIFEVVPDSTFNRVRQKVSIEKMEQECVVENLGYKSDVLSGKKVLYHCVFDLFPQTSRCVDVNFGLFSD